MAADHVGAETREALPKRERFKANSTVQHHTRCGAEICRGSSVGDGVKLSHAGVKNVLTATANTRVTQPVITELGDQNNA
jgi:hypothetical protein